jgi:acyl-CoA synthetase (NDP forming)
MVGPNGMGVLNACADVRLNASFAETLPPPGGIALASQSGGVGLAILQLAAERHLGVSTFVSLGNKADVSGNDLIQYGESDPATSVLLLYLESFGNPRRFAQLARRIGRQTPIVAVKSGRTEAGSRAAGSHTAGLASSETAVTALFRQAGVTRADTIDEMLDVAACLDLQPLPNGTRVAIVTNAGGPGIMAADACVTAGLEVVELPAPIRQRLSTGVAAQASLGNPVDLVAGAGEAEYRHALSTLLAAAEVDSVLVIYMPIDVERTSAVLSGIGAGVVAGRAGGGAGKPVLACFMLQKGQPQPIAAGGESVPSYAFPENAVRALGKVAAYARWRAEPPGLYWDFDDVQVEEAREMCRAAASARGDTWLMPDEVMQVLTLFGLPVVQHAVARSEEEAVALSSAAGYPVVLKISSPHVLHKTEAGGVHLNLRSAGEVRSAYQQIARRLPAGEPGPGEGVLVQPMVRGAIETIVGLTEDPSFGPLVAFGLGGVEVELLRDVAFRIAPLTDRDADALIGGVRSAPLLRGYRGRPPGDVEALRTVLLRVSLMGQRVPEIIEMDLNPMMVLTPGEGCRIVDARIRVGPEGYQVPAGPDRS